MCHELEEYSSALFPYELTANIIKFDIPCEFKFLTQYQGLRGYIQSRDIPNTGELLFSEIAVTQCMLSSTCTIRKE